MGLVAKADKRKAEVHKNGSGKKKKIFSESLGKEHLLSLSKSIAEKQASRLQDRVNRAKEKSSWEKQKRSAKMQSTAKGKTLSQQTSEGAVSAPAMKNSLVRRKHLYL